MATWNTSAPLISNACEGIDLMVGKGNKGNNARAGTATMLGGGSLSRSSTAALESIGYDVIGAVASGEEALRKVDGQRRDTGPLTSGS